MRIFLVSVLGLLYVKRRGTLVKLLSSRQNRHRYGYCAYMKISISQLDLMFSVNVTGLVLSLELYWMILINVLMTLAYKARCEHLQGRLDGEIRRAVIHLLFETYYAVSIGMRFDQMVQKLDGNLVVDEMFRIEGSTELKLMRVGQEINNKRFNRLINLIRQMEVYDSSVIMDELDQLIEMTLKDDFDAMKLTANKMSELFTLPMALNLVNMTAMIIYPFISDWYF